MPGPFGSLPPEIASALNRGNYGQALRKGGETVAKEVAKNGRRIIQPIEKMMESTLQKEAMTEEFIESAELAEELEAVGAEELAADGFAIARAFATGLSTVGEVVAGAATSEVIAPLALFCFIGGLAICLSSKPAVAAPLKQEFRRTKSMVKPFKLPRFPPGQTSDARLKHSVRRLPAQSGRPNLYSFAFLGDTARHTGVLAQEVLRDPRHRHAVRANAAGFLTVDYGALGLALDGLDGMRVAGEACIERIRAAERAAVAS